MDPRMSGSDEFRSTQGYDDPNPEKVTCMYCESLLSYESEVKRGYCSWSSCIDKGSRPGY